MTLIDDNLEITNRDSYTGQKTLRDYVNWTIDIKKRNAEKKYFNFFVLFLAYKNLKNGF